MAEGVVGALIGKLGSALANEAASFASSIVCHEASALARLFGEIHEVKEELESMQAFLHGVERFKDTDETTGIFVKKMRGLTFEIEDVVDEFTYKLNDRHGGIAAKMKKRITHVKTWHRLAHKLHEIKAKLERADRRNVRYSMRGFDQESARRSTDHSKYKYEAFYVAREDNLVGIKTNKELLLNWLGDDLEQSSMITTVWGMGGVGKTTLVSHVYHTIKVDFDATAWLTVSNSYQVEDLLKHITSEFGIPSNATKLMENIHNHLQGKRYLLILDDVWGVDVWFNIRDAFPMDKNSRFVITSRNHQVALLATKNCIIEMKPLEEEHSWQLFCKEAFWKHEQKICPADIETLAHKFVDRCKGLPIAIACIGRLLSCKTPTYSEWEDVYNELEVQLTNNVIIDVNIILKVSLEDLPYNLKNCFLLCALYPEDYKIKRGKVTRHWMSAGFIPEKENKTFEEVAEGYLNELVNRSLLQVVDMNVAGKVTGCRMHDIIRILALTKANEECFCTIFDGTRTFSVEGARRLSIQCADIEQLSLSGATHHLRALYVFNNDICIHLLNSFLKCSNMLSTLDLSRVRIKSLPNEIFNLFNLRFLCLRHTGIEILSEEIGRLQNLEVLDVFNAGLSTIPKVIAKLRKLRYLYVGNLFLEDKYKVAVFTGTRVPEGIVHLTGLHSLQYVESNETILSHLGVFTEIRNLGVANTRTEHFSGLCNSIMKMIHLVHLRISALDDEQVLKVEALRLPPTLSILELKGQLEKESIHQSLSSLSHLHNLSKLVMAFSKLDQDSLYSLQMLHGLCFLHLMRAFEGEKLHFCAESFPKLRTLRVWDAPNLRQIEIEESAMQSLARLTLRDCPELMTIPDGIEHLAALEELHLEQVSEDLIEKLRRKGGEPSKDLLKINYIRKVTVRVIHKNIWERIR